MENGVILKDGTEIDADLVVQGVGFIRDYSYFDQGTRDLMEKQKDGLFMYRQIIPPKV